MKTVYCSDTFLVVSTDCSPVQRPAAPLPFFALKLEDTRSVTRSNSTPEESLSLRHSSPTPPHQPSTAINADSPVSVSSNALVQSPVKASGEPKKLLTPSRTTSVPQPNPADKTGPSQHSQDAQTNSSTKPFMGNTPNQKKNPPPVIQKKNDPVASTGTPAVQTVQTRRALFNHLPSHTPVRRTKSEGFVRVNAAVAGQAQSAVPQVTTDATMNDRLWSKLDPGSHRDSMSSSSSISSNDTVIDLSLPNLSIKGLTSLPTVSSTCNPPWVTRHRSALLSYDAMRIVKSKSNPNLQQSESPKDELSPHPLQSAQPSFVDSSNRLTQRRHTWSRLYMEGLKESSNRRQSTAAMNTTPTSSVSKSLGDLTSDDISCNFDSKYRSISRSFIVRPTRDQLRKGFLQKTQPSPSNLTEQLRKLTDVEPLTASDFEPRNRPRESEEESVDETMVRRTSSRSQSRVRYIANRAKKAQERQRLQGLAQGRNASFSMGSGSSASPIEERGNPEGACCVARSPCNSPDLLSQLTPLESPSPIQSQFYPDPENSGVYFMIKL